MTGADFKARREAAGFTREEIAEIASRPWRHCAAATVLHAEQGRLQGYHCAWPELAAALELAEGWRAEEIARASALSAPPPHRGAFPDDFTRAR